MHAYLRHPPPGILYQIIGCVIGIIACLWLFPSAGTGDVGLYTGIMESFRANGIQQLFSCIKEACPGHLWNYPPLYLHILFFSQLIGGSLLTNFLLLKTVIALFYTVSIAIVGYFAFSIRPIHTHPSREILRGVFLGLTGASILINTHGLGYIDIFTYPFIILAFLLMAKHKYFLSGAFFACGFLIKWIPVIMLPLFILHVLRQDKKGLLYFLMGVALPVITTGWSSWGIHFISDYMRSVSVSTQDAYFAAAPTLPWLWTMIFPHITNGLPDNLFIFLDDTTRTAPVLFIYRAFKFAFLGYYLWVIYEFFISTAAKQTIRPLLLASTYTYIGYFFITSGVHENHLMMGVLCALLLAILTPKDKYNWLYRSVDFISAGSMILFYGFSGTPFIHINMDTIALPVTITLLFCSWFIYRVTRLQDDFSEL